MSVVLLFFSALFTLVFVLNNTVQVLRRRDNIGFVGTLLAFLAVLVPLSTLLYSYWFDAPQSIVKLGIVVLAVAIIALSIPNFVIEFRRAGRNLLQSRGILGIGVGVLLIVIQFSVPLTSAYLSKAPESTAPADSVQASEPLAEPSATIPAFFTNTPVPTLTSTRTPRPTLTATSTRRPFGRPTATPSATFAATACNARTGVNLRLRTEPNTSAETLLTIPFEVTLPVFGRNVDSTWWFVEYNGVTGWVAGEYLTLDGDCSNVTAM